MKTHFLGIFIFAAVVLALGCSGGDVSSSNSGPEKQSLPTPSTSNNSIASDSRPANANTAPAAGQDPFWAMAADGGMTEVELGRMAAGKAQNAEVKKFAEMMIADHGKANAELIAMAGRKGVTLPTQPSSEHQSLIGRLQGLSGAEFDKAYTEAMVAAHEKDVAAFRDRSQTAPDADVKAFAAKTLPTLEQHLNMIKGIQSKLK